jgi:FkbM family methyltransferase
VLVSLNKTSLEEWQLNNLEHLRYEYDLKPEDLVIDVGAYRGEWASQMFCRYGCRLILVEPGPWVIGFPVGEVINKAASTHAGKLKFGGAYYYTSAYEEPTHEYECFDINSLLAKYEVIALLKLNVEGAEYSLLNHIINAGLQMKILNLQIQFHQIERKPFRKWYKAIASKLSETHKLTWRYAFCWENWEKKC